MAAVTMSQLRSLARLYRGGVEGAAEQLDAHIEHSAEQLAAVVGFRPEEVPRLREVDNRVGVLATAIESAGAHHRKLRQGFARKQAEALVIALLNGARRVDAEVVEVRPAALDDLVACGGYDWLTFDSEFVRRGMPRGLLRAFFRECRAVTVHSASVENDLLVLCYAGSHSRGVVRLAFHHVPGGADALVVPLERVPQHDAHEPARVHAAEALDVPAQIEPATPQHAREPVEVSNSGTSRSGRPPSTPPSDEGRPCATRPRSQPRSGGFLHHLVAAIVESL